MTQSIDAPAKIVRRIDRSLVVTAAIVVVLVLLPALVKLISYAAYPGPDDSFIHIAVAEHILRGDGWGVVSNDRMNLSSSPIFTLLLLPVLAIGSIGLAQILSLAFASIALAVTFFATRTVTASSMCGIAALAVAAANVHLWRWSGTVMETSLAYLAVTIIAAATIRLLMQRRGSVWDLALLGVLIGLGTLVRYEIGIFLPLSMVALAFSRRADRRQIAAILGGFMVTTAALGRVRHHLFRICATDDFLCKDRRTSLSEPLRYRNARHRRRHWFRNFASHRSVRDRAGLSKHRRTRQTARVCVTVAISGHVAYCTVRVLLP